MDEHLGVIVFIGLALLVLSPIFVIGIAMWHDLGTTIRPPWKHPDDCPCSPCIDKAVQREVGHLERKRRIQEIRNAMADLERERRDRP